MRNYYNLPLTENREIKRNVLTEKWHLFFLGVLLFLFTTTTFGDLLSNDITNYPKPFQKRLKDAQRAFQAEEWREALQLYQRLTEEAPEFPIVHIGVGDAAAKLKDYPTAIAAFQRALQHLSTEPQGNITKSRLRVIVQAKLAAAYHRNKELDEADTWFQKAVKGTGEDTPAAWYVALGQIETERGNLEQARRYYIVAVQLHPDTTAAYNNLGHVLLKLNRIDEADAVFREALAQDETLASAAFGRGKVGLRRGQLTIARRFYERAVRYAPREPVFHESLADVLRDIGNAKEAKAAETRYRRTLAERYLRQAHWFIQEKQLRPALVPLQKALDTDDTFTPALKDYAYVQMQLGELTSARRSYQRVLTIEPTSRQALLHLGIIEAKLGDQTTAVSYYLTLIQHEPDFMNAYVQLANLHESIGDLEAAGQALTMGIQHEPTWAPGYLWRGKIYQKQGASDMAETDFRRAVQLAPDVSFPKEALASLLAWENRKLDEALTLAETAVKSDGQPAHRATLALVYHRLNRVLDAGREIEAAFAQAPNHLYILKIRSEILKTDP
ncbi:MAG: tetratricopeptide repeat protein [Candidatus Poribacteria bacterium]|nr:tetratricopeptide repeat protein [Candidatus Poribacteria bacterium]